MGGEGTALTGDGPAPQISLPIEGQSHWLIILRMMALGIVGVVFVMGLVFMLMGTFSGEKNLAIMMGGVTAFLILEYILFLKIVIPRLADYGRYRVFEDRVEFFPLSALGLSIRSRIDTEVITRFEGVVVQESHGHSGAGFRLVLVHTAPGKTLRLHSFVTMHDAHVYAEELAAALGMKVISMPQKRKNHS